MNLQKTISRNLYNFNDSTVSAGSYPFWIELPESECETQKNLKEIAAQITEITVLPILYNNNFFKCPVKITLNKKNFDSELTLCRLISSDSKTFSQEDLKKIIPAEKEFPLGLKIFRVGLAEASENTKILKDFVWKKMK